MKVGERGQVTIPKEIRDRFGIGPETEVEFVVEDGAIVLRKRPKPLALAAWKGYAGKELREMGLESVDEFLDRARGR